MPKSRELDIVESSRSSVMFSMGAFLSLVFLQQFGSFGGGDFAPLELVQNSLFVPASAMVSQDLIYHIEPLAHRWIGNAEFLFHIANLSLAAEKNEDEFL
jgi:hypothetical protein